jgi:hypothetical protein
MPDYEHIGALNADLARFCDASLTLIVAPNAESIGQQFAGEQPMLQALPCALPRACVHRCVRINKFSEVCFERNWYSVPSQYALRNAILEIYEDRLRVIVMDEAVAEHRRGFGTNERFLDPVHYIGLLQQKHQAAETALVLADGRIPQVLHTLFQRYREHNNANASRRWTQVLSLLAGASVDELAQTVTLALALGTDDPAAIELLLRQRSLPKPAADIDRGSLPIAARLEVVKIDLSLYATMELMEGAA